jgi:predicted DsbA family dithiol-disulfide isomerase
MRIEVWSDVVCPWCYIGKRRLEAALAKFPARDQVQIVYRAYELDPEAPRDSNQSTAERLASKYGGGLENAKAMMERVSQVAAQDGLEYHLDRTKVENTFDAHRLMAFAATQGKQLELAEILFKSHFTEGKRLSDHAVLADLAVTAGLDRAAAAKTLADPTAFADQVRDDEQKARTLNIRGVPCAVVDGKYGISGAQPVEAFTEVLDHCWKQKQN